MTVITWLAIALAGLLIAALGVSAVGAARWAERVRIHTRTLEAGSAGAQDPPAAPARYDASELAGLPVPVQRYFRTVLTPGQPIVSAVTLDMQGTMNLSADGQQWKPFTSRQRVVTRRPGFLWDARIELLPFVPVRVEDSYIAGQGTLLARVLGAFTVADSQGAGEIARGELMRYFAEAAWYPTALLPSQGVRWAPVDDTAADATLVDGPITLTLRVRFDDAGLIASVHAESRGAGVDAAGVMTMLPWDCALSNYQRQDGMLIPMTGEAAWVRPEGRTTYFVGHVRTVRYTFGS